MKKISNMNLIIIVVLFLALGSVALFFVGTSYAVDDVVTASNPGTISVVCDDVSVLPGSNITCTVKGTNFTTEVSSFTGKIALGSNLTLVSSSYDSGLWQGSADGGVIDLYTDSNKTGTFVLSTFVVKAGDVNTGVSTNIKLQNMEISDENFDEIALNDVSTDIRIMSNINDLSSLTVSGVSFNFNASTTSYSITSSASQVTISAVAANANAKISGDVGTKTLSYGSNNFNVTVTSEAGTSKTYKITITRPENLSFSSDIIVNSGAMQLKLNSSGVTAANLLSKITTSGTVTITNASGASVSNSDVVGTGFIVTIKLDSKTDKYTVVINGDTSGDGKVTVADVTKLFQHYRKTSTMGAIYIEAGDVMNDDVIKLTDVAKLFQYVQKTIDSL